MQIKPTTSYLLTPVSMATITKTENTKWLQACAEIEIFVHCWKDCKMVPLLWNTVLRFFNKLKIEQPCDPAVPLLVIYPDELKAEFPRDLYTHAYSSTIKNIQEVDATQISIGEWMGKHNMVHTYNQILFSLKNERNPVTWYNMDELWGHYVKWNKPDGEGQIPCDLIFNWNIINRRKKQTKYNQRHWS